MTDTQMLKLTTRLTIAGSLMFIVFSGFSVKDTAEKNYETETRIKYEMCRESQYRRDGDGNIRNKIEECQGLRDEMVEARQF